MSLRELKKGDKLAKGSIIKRTASGIKYELTVRMQEFIKRGLERNARELTKEELAEAAEWEASLPLATPLPTGEEKFAVIVPRKDGGDEQQEEEEGEPDGDNVPA